MFLRLQYSVVSSVKLTVSVFSLVAGMQDEGPAVGVAAAERCAHGQVTRTQPLKSHHRIHF